MIRRISNASLFKDYLNNYSYYLPSVAGKHRLLQKKGEQRALSLFKEAAKRIPAYGDFLKNNSVKPTRIKNIDDFKNIPATTKENYVMAYSFKDRTWDGSLTYSHTISTSSGTTGEPCFWPRDLQTEIDGALQHDFIFTNIFGVDRKRTLFLNGFALGNWIAGTFTLACTHLVSFKGYPLVNMAPGYNAQEIIALLKNVSPYFEQTIVSGHTPFLKEVVERAEKSGINIKKVSLKLLGTGQGITENWREYIVQKLKAKDYFRTMINLYGSADASLMGFETPQSIAIRKLLTKKRGLSKKIFNDERLPSLYNYDPRLIYFEEVGGELHITKYSGAPLIRYNIHDTGGVFSYGKIVTKSGEPLNILMKKSALRNTIKLPFVYLYGREKFMVKIYGANIYTEHVLHALNHVSLQPILTGRFVMEQDYDNEHNPILICNVELNPGIKVEEQIRINIESIFVQEIRKLNSEYNFVLRNVGDKVRPHINMFKHGHEKYFPREKIKKNA